MKRKSCFAAVLTVFVLFCTVAFASPARVVDMAGLLETDQLEKLTDKLDALSGEYNADVAVVTADSLDGKTPQDYADDYFDYNGYGIGDDNSGIMLVVCMGTRQWHITTHGSCISKFSDSDLADISQEIVPYLSEGDYFGAFDKFADCCADELCVSDDYSDDYSDEDIGPFSPGLILISLGAGVIIAFIAVFIMSLRLKSVRNRTNATEYIADGSLDIRERQDVYLYSHVTQTRIEHDSDSGSSTHQSSSGQTHGGAGGSF